MSLDEIKASFPGIEPNDGEILAGQLLTYRMAAERMHREENQRRKQLAIEAAKKMYSYQEQKDFAIETGEILGQQFGFKFQVPEHWHDVLHLLCLYFTNDPEFENYDYMGAKYSLSKGIWLQSADRGTGKSVLLSLFRVNKRQCFDMISMHNLWQMFRRGGNAGIDHLNTYSQIQSVSPGARNFYQHEHSFCYDELFGEEKVNYMGNAMDISAYMINSLYDIRKYHGQFYKFHCTSNYDGEAIEHKCGKTIRSRMKEMFNLIKLDGPDMRMAG